MVQYPVVAQQKPRPWLPAIVAAAGLAAAAAVGLVVLTKDEMPAYEIGAVTGAVKTVRKGHDESQDLVFAPTSQVSITLAAKSEGPVPKTVTLFVTDAQSVLQRVDEVTVTRHQDGTFTSFVLTGTGREFFGDTPGSKIVAMIVASGPDDVSGKSVSQAIEQAGERCLLLKAAYQTQLE